MLLGVLFISTRGFSATVTCNVNNSYPAWTTLNTPFELNIGQVNAAKNANMTVGAGVADYTVLYTISQVNVGVLGETCSTTSGLYMYYTMLSAHGSVLNTIGNDAIYPTSVPGIGISIKTAYLLSNRPIKLYPEGQVWNSVVNGQGYWVAITIWKVPGTIPVSAGSISFTGPTLAPVIMGSGVTFTSSDQNRILDGGKAWINGSRVLTGTLMIQPTTCDLVMPNTTVQMGTHDGGGRGDSAWKDASFKLSCSNAYGYGGSLYSIEGYKSPNAVPPSASTLTANSVKNNPIRIQIQPYTPVIDATSGILALDGTGAEGYGIQLAWGDATTQNSGVPANPVQLNAWTSANSLNSAYSSSAYAIGASAISGTADGTIKMAARYIRTSGDIVAGPANAAVEVLVNYE